MATAIPDIVAGVRGRTEAVRWLGLDDRGVELEVIAVMMPGNLCMVIHMMPTSYRKGNRHG